MSYAQSTANGHIIIRVMKMRHAVIKRTSQGPQHTMMIIMMMMTIDDFIVSLQHDVKPEMWTMYRHGAWESIKNRQLSGQNATNIQTNTEEKR